MPMNVWHDTMDLYFPKEGWMRARRETIDRLTRCKVASMLLTWDDALSALLKEAGELV